MFNLEDYKKELIDFYRSGKDNTEEERARRRAMLGCKDTYLEKIITNTEEFIYYLLTKMKEENNIVDDRIFLYIELDDEKNTTYCNDLNLNLTGGWPSDTFFYLEDKEKLISMRLLHKFFEGFFIDCDCDDIEMYNEEEGVGSIDSYWWFHISGPTKEFKQLYDKAQNLKGKELVNVLKRVRANKTK